MAATIDEPFAGFNNVVFAGDRWTHSISHAELIRESTDETLTVTPEKMQMVFQGVTDEGSGSKPYGEIPWRLGLLTQD